MEWFEKKGRMMDRGWAKEKTDRLYFLEEVGTWSLKGCIGWDFLTQME